MLTVLLPEFDQFPEVEVRLEHSLLSLSKWESIHHLAFFRKEPQTEEQTKSYVRQMLLCDAPPMFEERITNDVIIEVQNYINDPQTATTFREAKQAGGGDGTLTTNELIYYWLVQFNIPFQPCETWHLNRLFVLIKIAGIKQSKPKPMSRAEAAAQQRKLNAERRNQLGTAG